MPGSSIDRYTISRISYIIYIFELTYIVTISCSMNKFISNNRRKSTSLRTLFRGSGFGIKKSLPGLVSGIELRSMADYMYSVCDGDDGGGGGGEGGDGGYQSQTPHLDQIYASASTLTSTQQGNLEIANSQFQSANAIYAYIWQSITNSNSRITFKIDPSINGIGSLSEDGLTMSFKAEEYITESVLQEELIHKYQSINYGVNFDSSIRNYELEAKVLQDIVSYVYGGPTGHVTPYFLLEVEKL